MNVLVWFKRDLRVADHPALVLAAGLGAILPLYVAEPDLWGQPDMSARQWGATSEALADLQLELARLGGALAVRCGEVVDVLSRLCRQHNITTIVSHEETGNAWTYARDQRVAAWARDAGVAWHELAQSGVVRRLAGRDGWARQRDRFVSSEFAQLNTITFLPEVEVGTIPTATALRLAHDRCAHRQSGGRGQALLTLETFLAHRGATYRKAMSSPLSAERACSRLSVHLATGTISVREAVQATLARQSEKPTGGWSGALASFQSRLAWRDHFIQKLEDQPSIETRALYMPTEHLRPRVPDASRLAAWSTGETGLPFVDACIRYLGATGWLNFRMRAMLMSFASYHLWLDWRSTGMVLARAFTDYEPGIHWPQVQMQSGTTGINTPRIYNPVKQGCEQDPTGMFTRRWCPELSVVPDAFLQEPWKWAEAGSLLGRRYPEPIIDVAEAARTARDAIWAVRKRPDYGTEAARIVERHASRVDGTRRFVNDRAPVARKRRVMTAQLAMDF